MTSSPSETAVGTSRLGAILARRWVLTRLVPAVAVVILLLYVVPVLVDWKAATDAKGAEPVGSATFSELVQPPSLEECSC